MRCRENQQSREVSIDVVQRDTIVGGKPVDDFSFFQKPMVLRSAIDFAIVMRANCSFENP